VLHLHADIVDQHLANDGAGEILGFDRYGRIRMRSGTRLDDIRVNKHVDSMNADLTIRMSAKGQSFLLSIIAFMDFLPF
jgi:hypothetical protein